MFSILVDIQEKRTIEVNLDNECHYLIVGNTGVGKTTFCMTLLAKIAKYYPDTELYLLDFKFDNAFVPFSNSRRYFKYTECQNGLSEVYERFSKRLSGIDCETHHIVLFFDELASFINFIEKKADKELQQRRIAEMLMMGRSKQINIIVALQRPDAELLRFGSRNQFIFKLAIGNNSSETRKMIFPSSDTDFLPCKKGFGYVSIHDNAPTQVALPIVTKHELVEKEIAKILSNGISSE